MAEADWDALTGDAESLQSPPRTRASELDALGARRRRQRQKNEVAALREQVDQLTAHLGVLRSERAISGWHERAVALRKTRREAEETNKQLKLALATVRAQTCEVKRLVSSGHLDAVKSLGVNMRDLQHTPSYLRKDLAQRARDFQSLCTQFPLDHAMQIVLRETASVSSSPVQVVSQMASGRPGEMAVTTVARVEVDSIDYRSVFVAACQAYAQCGLGWRGFRKLQELDHAVEKPDEATTYAVWEEKHEHELTGDTLSLAVGSLTFARLTDDYGLAVRDHVDVDEMYPMISYADGRRHCTASLVVRVERCADGFERAVCHNVCTKIFRHRTPSISFAHAASTITDDMKLSEMKITRTIQDTVASMQSFVPNWWEW